MDSRRAGHGRCWQPPMPQSNPNQETTLSDALVERLIEWGVDTIFGLPGDNINGIIEALRKAKERIRFIHVRHETVGSLAAVGYSKFTGKIGVCFATAGPGAAHLLNGILDAHMDRVPLLAITGLTSHDLSGSEGLQAADADKMFAPFTVYNERITGPAHVLGAVDTACRRALAVRGPVHLTIPSDWQSKPMSDDKTSPENVPGHTAPRYESPALVPERSALERAARLLAAKPRIVVLAGTGARGAADELLEMAEKLAAPITKAMLGKDIIPDDHPTASEAGPHCDDAFQTRDLRGRRSVDHRQHDAFSALVSKTGAGGMRAD
jgi:pyruvate dehydrogenase (quinone)